MNESMQAEAVSVSLMSTLCDAQKCLGEVLCIFDGAKTAEFPRIDTGGEKSLRAQVEVASAVAGNVNNMAHEVLKDCHAMMGQLGK